MILQKENDTFIVMIWMICNNSLRMSGMGLDRNVRFEHLGILTQNRKDLNEQPKTNTDYEPKRTRTSESVTPP